MSATGCFIEPDQRDRHQECCQECPGLSEPFPKHEEKGHDQHGCRDRGGKSGRDFGNSSERQTRQSDGNIHPRWFGKKRFAIKRGNKPMTVESGLADDRSERFGAIERAGRYAINEHDHAPDQQNSNSRLRVVHGRIA